MADVELEPYVFLSAEHVVTASMDSVSITATLGFRQLQVPSLAHSVQ